MFITTLLTVLAIIAAFVGGVLLGRTQVRRHMLSYMVNNWWWHDDPYFNWAAMRVATYMRMGRSLDETYKCLRTSLGRCGSGYNANDLMHTAIRHHREYEGDGSGDPLYFLMEELGPRVNEIDL